MDYYISRTGTGTVVDCVVSVELVIWLCHISRTGNINSTGNVGLVMGKLWTVAYQ